jgi:hypothetical protein
MAMVIVGNDNYIDRLKMTEDWYSEAFISGFTALASHDAHMTTVPFPTDDKVMLVLTPYPNKPIMETLPRGDATHFFSVVFISSHFAVLYYNINSRKVSVFDDKNMPVKLWMNHIVHTCKKYELELVHHVCKCKYVEEKVTDTVGRKHIRMNLEICFHPSIEPWIVTNTQTYTQDDDFNCGPIACLKVTEINGFLRNGTIEQIHERGNNYRTVVMEYYSSAVIKYGNNLKVELSTKYGANN